MKYLFNLIKIGIIIATLLSCGVVSAQDDEFENYTFDDNDTQKLPYFALSFGGNIHSLFMKYDEINKKLGNSDIMKELQFSGPIFGWGINFFSAISPLLNNTRVGISYFSGNQSQEFNKNVIIDSPVSTSIDINYYRKLSITNTGLHFDYAIVPIKSMAILPGLGVKFGTMTLEQYSTGMQRDWNSKPNFIDTELFNEKLEYSYIAIEPQVNIEYAITGFFMLKAAAGYSLPFDNPFVGSAWTINGSNKYTGVPKDIKPQGFTASVGIYLGLFNY